MCNHWSSEIFFRVNLLVIQEYTITPRKKKQIHNNYVNYLIWGVSSNSNLGVGIALKTRVHVHTCIHQKRKLSKVHTNMLEYIIMILKWLSMLVTLQLREINLHFSLERP